MEPRLPGARMWAWVRAALVSTFVLAQGVNGCPLTAGSAEALQTPEGQTSIRQWSDLLSAIGIEMSPGEVGQRYVAFNTEFTHWHQVAHAPFERYFYVTQIFQRWGLFGKAVKTHYRLRVEARRGTSEWDLLFRAADPEHTFLADVLRYRRIRGIWTPRSSAAKPPYPHLCSWIADRVFERHPEYDQVVVRLERIPEHLQPLDEPQFELEQYFRRNDR